MKGGLEVRKLLQVTARCIQGFPSYFIIFQPSRGWNFNVFRRLVRGFRSLKTVITRFVSHYGWNEAKMTTTD